MRKVFFLIVVLFSVAVVVLPFLQATPVFGAGLAPDCGFDVNEDGRYDSETEACQPCHAFVLFDNILDFIIQLALGATPLILIIGGVMYAVSTAGGGGMTRLAQSTVKATVIGVLIILLAWVIVNLFFQVIGVSDINPTGLNFTKWWQVDCPAAPPPPPPPPPGTLPEVLSLTAEPNPVATGETVTLQFVATGYAADVYIYRGDDVNFSTPILGIPGGRTSPVSVNRVYWETRDKDKFPIGEYRVVAIPYDEAWANSGGTKGNACFPNPAGDGIIGGEKAGLSCRTVKLTVRIINPIPQVLSLSASPARLAPGQTLTISYETTGDYADVYILRPDLSLVFPRALCGGPPTVSSIECTIPSTAPPDFVLGNYLITVIPYDQAWKDAFDRSDPDRGKIGNACWYNGKSSGESPNLPCNTRRAPITVTVEVLSLTTNPTLVAPGQNVTLDYSAIGYYLGFYIWNKEDFDKAVKGVGSWNDWVAWINAGGPILVPPFADSRVWDTRFSANEGSKYFSQNGNLVPEGEYIIAILPIDKEWSEDNGGIDTDGDGTTGNVCWQTDTSCNVVKTLTIQAAPPPPLQVFSLNVSPNSIEPGGTTAITYSANGFKNDIWIWRSDDSNFDGPAVAYAGTAGLSGTKNWDGRDENGNIVPSGVYTVTVIPFDQEWDEDGGPIDKDGDGKTGTACWPNGQLVGASSGACYTITRQLTIGDGERAWEGSSLRVTYLDVSPNPAELEQTVALDYATTGYYSGFYIYKKDDFNSLTGAGPSTGASWNDWVAALGAGDPTSPSGSRIWDLRFGGDDIDRFKDTSRYAADAGNPVPEGEYVITIIPIDEEWADGAGDGDPGNACWPSDSSCTITKTLTVSAIVSSAPSMPTVYPFCDGPTSKVNIYWDEVEIGSSGYSLDLDDDNDRSNGFWNKWVPAGTLSTVGPDGFDLYDPDNILPPNEPVFVPGNIYDVRIYYTASRTFGPVVTFPAFSCEGVPLPPGADTTPPVRSGGGPTGALPAETTETVISLTTDDTICRYSTTAGTAYDAMPSAFTTTGGTSHSTTVTGLSGGNTYNYYVRCKDKAGNVNTNDYVITFSVGLLLKVSSLDVNPNSVTAGQPVAVTYSASGFVNDIWIWNGSDTGFAGPAVAGLGSAGLSGTKNWDTTGVSAGDYIVTVIPYDREWDEDGGPFDDPAKGGDGDGKTGSACWPNGQLAGAQSGACSTITKLVTISAPPPIDITPPVRSNAAPSGALPAGTTQTNISLSTNESATCRYAAVAGTAYDSMLNAFTITGGTSHSTTVTGLSDGSAYNYYVRCKDSAGNANTDDFPITFSVASSPLPGDITPPLRSNGQPAGVLPYGTTQTVISLATNENATCRYSTVVGIGYSAMTNNFSAVGGVSHSATVMGLSNGNTYNYYAKCQDAAGNANPDDFAITFSVSAFIFADDFEGDLSQWNLVTIGAGNSASITTERAYSGSKSLKMNFANAAAGNSVQLLYEFSAPRCGILSARVYDDGLPKGILGGITNSEVSEMVLLGIQSDVSSNYKYRAGVNSSANDVDSGMRRVAGWHQVEFVSTPMGSYAKLDGKSLSWMADGMRGLFGSIAETGVNNRLTCPKKVVIASTWQSGTVYWDNVEFRALPVVPASIAERERYYVNLFANAPPFYDDLGQQYRARGDRAISLALAGKTDEAKTNINELISSYYANPLNWKLGGPDPDAQLATRTFCYGEAFATINMGMAAWLVWNNLDSSTKQSVKDIISTASDLAIRAKLDSCAADASFIPGGGPGERYAWLAALLSLAANMFPDEVGASIWESKGRFFAFHSFNTGECYADPSDGSSQCGKTLHNGTDDCEPGLSCSAYMMDEHLAHPHPQYALATIGELGRGALFYLKSGKAVPDEFKHNVLNVWNAHNPYINFSNYQFQNTQHVTHPGLAFNQCSEYEGVKGKDDWGFDATGTNAGFAYVQYLTGSNILSPLTEYEYYTQDYTIYPYGSMSESGVRWLTPNNGCAGMSDGLIYLLSAVGAERHALPLMFLDNSITLPSTK